MNERYCHHPNAESSRFCTSCGLVLKRKVCRCGACNSFTSNFCHHCGAGLNEGAGVQRDENEKQKPELTQFDFHVYGASNTKNKEISGAVNQDDIDDVFDI